MSPDQEARIVRELGRVNANVDMVRHDQRNLAEEVRTRFDRVESRLDRHGRRIAAIEEKIDHQPDEADKTGSFPNIDVAILRHEQQRLLKEQERRTDSGIWWKRQSAIWLIGGIGALAMLMLSSSVGLIIWALTRK